LPATTDPLQSGFSINSANCQQQKYGNKIYKKSDCGLLKGLTKNEAVKKIEEFISLVAKIEEALLIHN
jgi:hypothetical protein